jgi:hypothetical protein
MCPGKQDKEEENRKLGIFFLQDGAELLVVSIYLNFL